MTDPKCSKENCPGLMLSTSFGPEPFDALDADHNGFLSESEFQVHRLPKNCHQPIPLHRERNTWPEGERCPAY
jgi:hypothetical protein